MKTKPAYVGKLMKAMLAAMVLSTNTALCPVNNVMNIERSEPITRVDHIKFKPYFSVSETNNPFNIRRDSINTWIGKDISNEGPFERFVNEEYGIRAGLILLSNYYHKHGLSTVQEIIYKFAPPHENNTEEYIDRICSEIGYERCQPMDLTSKEVMIKLAVRIIRFETGKEIDPLKVEFIYNKYFT